MHTPRLRFNRLRRSGALRASEARRRADRATAAAGVFVLASALLAGCALLEGPTPEVPEREAPVVPDEAPEFFPDGSAEENLPYFTEVLRDFSEGDTAVRGKAVVDAVVDAGFEQDDMQVSFDESKTGLVADSIYVSVRIDSDCLIGQVLTEDRTFVAKTMETVGPDSDLCLIGSTRAIDW